MLEQRQVQSLRLMQSPQQILLSTLLQLQIQALELRIENELELNPVLEEDLLQSDTDESADDNEEDGADEEFDIDDFFDNDDYSPPPQRQTDETIREMPQVSRQTFTEYLLEQVQQTFFDEEESTIANSIVWNINTNGYLATSLEDIAVLGEYDLATVKEVHSRVIRLDPLGVGATSLQECLFVQVEDRDEDDLVLRLIRDHFEDFANKRFEKVARDENISLEDINEAMQEIAKLNPKPGLSFSDQQLDYVIPDFIVEKTDGLYMVTLNDFTLPNLKISERYKTMVADRKNVDRETRNYLKKKIESARWLIASIYQRKLTMIKVMEAIVTRQIDWFDWGEGHLKPMIQKDIAKDVGMDHSTISRATDGKYVQTEHGVFALKTFFSEGLQKEDGEIVSTSNIKLRIKSIIESEPHDAPYSDDKLTKILADEGFKVARRTVAKYREQMNLPVARLRRKIGV